MKVDDTNLLSSTIVPAKDDLPEYCRVLGYVRPAINVEIRLPTEDWNGKFYMAGCGGSCGKLRSDSEANFSGPNSSGNSMNHGLRRNYAASSMDGGHWGKSNSDRRWANQNPVARFDYEERAVTETARVTKEMIRAYYGQPPKKSYFNGCSNGGRQGHMEAWKYPDDFDGVISGAPALRFTQLDILWTWEVRANTGPDGKNALAFAKIPMIARAVSKACADEGGLIGNPAACRFEPKSLQCEAADSPDCLTSTEVAVVEKWYSGPKNSKGEQLNAGFSRGTEPYWTAIEDRWRRDLRLARKRPPAEKSCGVGQGIRC